MIIDTSAAVAVLRAEPEATEFLDALRSAPRRAMSAASVLELAIVSAKVGSDIADEFLVAFRVEVLDVDRFHLRWARYAHVHFGRGSGSSAKLNFGDCLAYGAAKAEGQPLLFTGDDFVHTDIRSAIAR